ncbi:MAG: hypothetical protein ABIH18_02970 [Candidatus Omnitrophota bacterium]
MKIIKFLIPAIILLYPLSLNAQPPDKSTQSTTQKITVSLDVPSSGYSIKIKDVYETPKETLVLAVIQPPDPKMMVLTMIDTIRDSVYVEKITGKIKVFITGKNWNWDNTGGYIFINNQNEFYNETKNAKPLSIQSVTP